MLTGAGEKCRLPSIVIPTKQRESELPNEEGFPGRPLTERLENLGGKVEQGVPMVDFVEDTHYSFALEPMPESAG